MAVTVFRGSCATPIRALRPLAELMAKAVVDNLNRFVMPWRGRTARLVPLVGP
jgi:hypothetical protein